MYRIKLPDENEGIIKTLTVKSKTYASLNRSVK